MCVHMHPVWIVGLWHRGEVQHTEDVNDGFKLRF